MKDKLKAFDYVRGEFIAVSIGAKRIDTSTDHAKREHQSDTYARYMALRKLTLAPANAAIVRQSVMLVEVIGSRV
jgi:hypothetical protein